MVYRIITTTDQNEWERLLQSVNCTDVFFSHLYFSLNEKESGYPAELFVYEEGENIILYPYLKIPLHHLPFFPMTRSQDSYFDITSLEYGGFLLKSTDPEIFQRFLWAFTSHCTSAHIVTEFIRLHPFFPCPGQNNIEKVKDVYVIDLQQDLLAITMSYKKSNRNCLARAQREEVVVVQSKEKKAVDDFYYLYMKTMKRRNARSFYFYSREYIDGLLESFNEAGQLFVAYHHEKAISAAIFLSGGPLVHYYLAGSQPEYGKYGGSNSVLHAGIQWAKQNGFRVLNLGSGYRPGDSLSWFKSNFTTQTKPYLRYRKIHLPELYIQFTDAKEHYDAVKNVLAEPDFFPKYRG